MFAVIQSQTIIPTWMTKSPMCRFRWKLTSNVEWSPTTGYNDGNSNFKLDKSLYKYIINSWASNFTKIQTNKQEHSLLIIIFLTMVEVDSLITSGCRDQVKLRQFHITGNIDSSSRRPLINKILCSVTN